MAAPTFSILYTTVRHQEIPSVIRRWFGAAGRREDCEMVVTTDRTVWTGAEDGTLGDLCAELQLNGDQVICQAVVTPPWHSVHGWFKAARRATGRILFITADDVLSEEHWDLKILDCLRANHLAIDDEWVLHVDDLSKKRVPQLVHPIMSRTRMEKVGYYFHPQYTTMCPDRHVESMAIRDNVLIKAPHICFEHVHPDFGKRSRDQYDELQSGPWQYESGHRLFNWMKLNNFPRPSGRVPRSSADYTAYVQVIKDDFFLFEICQRLVDDGIRQFFFHVPTVHWSGHAFDGLFMLHLDKLTAMLEGQGVTVNVAEAYSEPKAGETRIETETRVRNDALREMRALGQHFAAIVDSDELWVRGTLTRIHELAKEGIQSVRCRMITALGMPPRCYLVNGNDGANIYIGPDTEFFKCRETVVPYIWLDGPPALYHFSGVRRTQELLLEKQFGSGHYGDPEYHFDAWIREVLPRIRIGDRNVSMYGDGSIWPEVRAWTPEDVAVLPEAIKTFLRL